jgi:hypothetical protein
MFAYSLATKVSFNITRHNDIRKLNAPDSLLRMNVTQRTVTRMMMYGVKPPPQYMMEIDDLRAGARGSSIPLCTLAEEHAGSGENQRSSITSARSICMPHMLGTFPLRVPHVKHSCPSKASAPTVIRMSSTVKKAASVGMRA